MSFLDQARAAKAATTVLRRLDRAAKDRGLQLMASRLREATGDVLAANRADLDRGRASGMAEGLLDRLALSSQRVEAMAAGLEALAGLSDPVGQVVRGWTTPQGVRIEQVRVPMGVIGIIYEARPNVTADAAGICLKSGNASLLRGSSSALKSNRAVVAALRAGLADAGVPADAVDLVEGGHDVTDEMMGARGLIDLLIPRGGAGLINAVIARASVPVIETGTGNCHLVVDSSADLGMAEAIVVNAKTQRPSVCNALETVLVLADIAPRAVPRLVEALDAAGVTVHGDRRSQLLDSRVVAARPDEYDAEYLSLDLAVKVVDSLDDAVEHIAAHGSGHSETIVTASLDSARRFQESVDAAAVLVNCSSRFVDGGEFGFGAEIGISTQKLHARGPMGLTEMTSTSYRLTGDGQVRLG